MTTLSLFWISSVAGALLFFVAGYLISRGQARRDDQIGWAPEPDLAGELRAREAALAELRQRLAETEARSHYELQAARDRIGELERRLDRQSARLVVSERQTTQLISTDDDLRRKLREHVNQLVVAKNRVAELETMHKDYVRLRTQRDESEHLRREIARLTAELRDARRSRRRVPRASAPRPPTGSGSVADSLQHSIERLLGTSTWAVVVADRVGFPVASVGDDGASLAAYSTLLAEAGERAHSFFSVSSPYQLMMIDREDARVSLWPFEVDGEPLSLVTLSGAPVDEQRAQRTIGEVISLLSRSRPPLSAVN